MEKQDLKSLTRSELLNWFSEKGIKKFRAKQVFNWIYKNGVNNFQNMTNIPSDLREKLTEKAYLINLEIKDKKIASDGTTKYLWELSDGHTIESVYLPFSDGRNSVCISSQVGCQMGCKFCATGINGLQRNLTPGEIVDQVLQIQKDISKNKFGEPRISNVVFMGMGEPLQNLNHVLKAINIFNDKDGLDIGMRRITVSTSGIVPLIRRLAREKLQITLAISLNAPDNNLRNFLMPINKKYPLEELIKAASYYVQKTGRRITFEYVLIRDINDGAEQAQKTASLLSDFICHVNLIPYNSVSGLSFKAPSRDSILRFKKVLEANGIETSIRQERGARIEAACGQLRRLRE